MEIEIISMEKTEFHIEEKRKDSDYGKRRTAVVYTKHGQFEYCKYEMLGTLDSYNYKDWCFLKVVSNFIEVKFKKATGLRQF